MKKRFCIALVLSLFLAITACGSRRTEESPNITPERNPAVPASSGEEPEPAKESTAEQAALLPAESARENTEQEQTQMKLQIQVADTTFLATLAENSSVDALKEQLADGPLTLYMRDYANMEKGADLGVTLPQNNEQMNTQAGDIILYQGRTLVIYYDTNSWSLTPIGKIDDVDAESLRTALGTGDVTVTIALE